MELRVKACPSSLHDLMQPKLFLDLDGVLADFDKSAERILGTDNIYKFEFVYGPELLWKMLHSDSLFFAKLNMMEDGSVLWNAVKHLEPTILTALPSTGAEKVDIQKRDWVRRWLGPNVPVITGRTKDKPKYASPGAILVDDRAVNKAAWEAAGGSYIVHTSAYKTIYELRKQGII